MGAKWGGCGWAEGVHEAWSMLRCGVKFRRLRAEGTATVGDDNGREAGWKKVVSEIWSTVSYLHASFWDRMPENRQ